MQRYETRVRRAFAEAAAVLWPMECAGCGQPDVGVCETCRSRLLQPRTLRFGEYRLRVAAEYEGEVRRIVLALKERGDRACVRACADALGALAFEPLASIAIVPGSRAGFLRRGFDPVALVCRRAGLPYIRLALDRAGAQKSRTQQQRANAAARVRVRARDLPRIRDRHVIVLDDVVTTGTTLQLAAAALRSQGAGSVECAAIAHVPKRARDVVRYHNDQRTGYADETRA